MTSASCSVARPITTTAIGDARKRPRATFRGGWFSAGDMAQRDDEGYIYLVDRKKDLFISGGINVYPREIEEVLFAHPAVPRLR